MRHFEKLLRLFPFSQRSQPESVVSIHGVDATEPPLLERPLNGPLDIEEVCTVFNDYRGPDVAYSVESWWDLWQYEDDWKLAPTRVEISSFGPEFDSGTERAPHDQEDFLIDFGVDSYYLPPPELAGSARLVESNIKSLLRLVHEIDSALPVTKRLLETEMGANFAERLQRALLGSESVQ